MKNYQKILTGLVSAGLAGWAYANVVEKRSLSSWTIERLLGLREVKKSLSKQSEEDFQKTLARFSEISDKSVNNPSKLVGMPVSENNIDGVQVFEWNNHNDPKQAVLFYLHGGAYINQPTPLHYRFVAKISKSLDARVVFPIYPKLPHHTFSETYSIVDKLYRQMLTSVDHPQQITIMGDSAGGGLALGFAMYARDHQLPQPKDIVLLSPWLDIATENPDIAAYQDKDPILGAWGLNQLGKMWSEGDSKEIIQNPYVSPLHGELQELGKISIFVGTHEIFYPDNEKLHHLLIKEKIDHHYIVADKMNHVYTIYPTPEAKQAQKQILEIIEENR